MAWQQLLVNGCMPLRQSPVEETRDVHSKLNKIHHTPFISHSVPFVPHLIGATGQNSRKLKTFIYCFLPRAPQRPVEVQSHAHAIRKCRGRIAGTAIFNQWGTGSYEQIFPPLVSQVDFQRCIYKAHQKILVRPDVSCPEWWPIQ